MKKTVYISPLRGQGVEQLILAILLFLITTTTYSQPINTYANDVVQPSAEAQIINKFIESPVNAYTGTISPGIMIHELSQGPLSAHR